MEKQGEADLRLLLEEAEQGAHVYQGLLGLSVHGAQEIQRHGNLHTASRGQLPHHGSGSPLVALHCMLLHTDALAESQTEPQSIRRAGVHAERRIQVDFCMALLKPSDPGAISFLADEPEGGKEQG